jgi:hypothetical protein
MVRRLIPSLIASAGILAGVHAQPERRVLAIRNVAVVDVRAGTVLERRTVIVNEGRIRSVGGDAAVPVGAESIDGTGRFLIQDLEYGGRHASTHAASAVCQPRRIGSRRRAARNWRA